MSYIGTWKFHSIGVMRNDRIEYISGEEYLKEPMPYINETNEEAVADELRERSIAVSMQIKVCEDGKLYLMTPIPEGTPQEELDAAIASGELILIDGMLSQSPTNWEERNGELWYNTGIEGEILDEKADFWTKAIDENGLFVIITSRFEKAD